MSQITVGLQDRKMLVTSYVDAYFWRCERCGWLGTGHYSIEAALSGAGKHWAEDHSLETPPVVERRDSRKVARGVPVIPEETP